MALDLRLVANRIASTDDADILLVNGAIEEHFDKFLWSALSSRKRKLSSLYLILVTSGGSANAAFRAARHVQGMYGQFRAVVPGWCKSAGTLVCVGATEIIMADLGELGPLDVQLMKPDDLGGRLSGLTLDSALRSLQTLTFNYFETFFTETIRKSNGQITTKTSADIASALTIGVMQPIFAQVDPVRLGEDYRSTSIAKEYAARLDLKYKNLVVDQDWRAIDLLVGGYPSHDFVIDRQEAQALFRRVRPLEGDLSELVTILGEVAVYPRAVARGEPPLVEFLNDEVPIAIAPAAPSPPRGKRGPGARGAAGRKGSG